MMHRLKKPVNQRSRGELHKRRRGEIVVPICERCSSPFAGAVLHPGIEGEVDDPEELEVVPEGRKDR